MREQLDRDKIAAGLGVTTGGEVRSRPGHFGAQQLAADVAARATWDSHWKTVLAVLFIPSSDRESRPLAPGVEDRWAKKALDLFGRVFGGATAFPKARGVWRDDERENNLVYDDPILIQ